MEELNRVIRHFAPVLASYLVFKYGLPHDMQVTLSAFLGELLGVVAVAVGSAIGYGLSLVRDRKRAVK